MIAKEACGGRSRFNRRAHIRSIAFLGAVGFLLVSAAGRADVYVWRDAPGAPKYSDPPPGEGARDVKKLGTPLKFFATFGASSVKTATRDGTSNDVVGVGVQAP